jgi:hypothetical protein
MIRWLKSHLNIHIGLVYPYQLVGIKVNVGRVVSPLRQIYQRLQPRPHRNREKIVRGKTQKIKLIYSFDFLFFALFSPSAAPNLNETFSRKSLKD